MERVAQSCASLLAQRRRGYSVAAAVIRGAGRRAEDKVPKRVMATKTDVNAAATTTAGEEKTPWVPDPVTGYYRPAGVVEIDPVDLRARLLARAAN